MLQKTKTSFSPDFLNPFPEKCNEWTNADAMSPNDTSVAPDPLGVQDENRLPAMRAVLPEYVTKCSSLPNGSPDLWLGGPSVAPQTIKEAVSHV